MADLNSYLAWRIVQGVGAQAGELLLRLDHAGRDGLLREVAFATELAGATPPIERAPPDQLARLLASGPTEYFAAYDRHRRQRARSAVVVTCDENRHPGSQNASALSAEFMSSNAEIEADGQPIVNLG
ncbi:MAG: hypothetical protein KatS3mg052_2480 [Candidatus Roseilinea sp.]|nr:MAG: hypothetical protein KatS3mg052_2480 [Candidatus Roseilinea sp.]